VLVRFSRNDCGHDMLSKICPHLPPRAPDPERRSISKRAGTWRERSPADICGDQKASMCDEIRICNVHLGPRLRRVLTRWIEREAHTVHSPIPLLEEITAVYLMPTPLRSSFDCQVGSRMKAEGAHRFAGSDGGQVRPAEYRAGAETSSR
jgi:hypothetical protein